MGPQRRSRHLRRRKNLNEPKRAGMTPVMPARSSFPRKKTHPKPGCVFWSGRRGSNSLPPPWQGGALPDELRPHFSATRDSIPDLPPFVNRKMKKSPWPRSVAGRTKSRLGLIGHLASGRVHPFAKPASGPTRRPRLATCATRRGRFCCAKGRVFLQNTPARRPVPGQGKPRPNAYFF